MDASRYWAKLTNEFEYAISEISYSLSNYTYKKLKCMMRVWRDMIQQHTAGQDQVVFNKRNDNNDKSSVM